MTADRRARAHAPAQVAPWVLVAGGFHGRGGMDKANAALLAYLLDQGVPVHLVAHSVADEYACRPGVVVHRVVRPAGSVYLGGWSLGRRGRSVARRVGMAHPGTQVVVNGGNCTWPGVNWVHSVHHAWPCADHGAPLWFKTKNRLVKMTARRNERTAVRAARLVIANSNRTRDDVIRHLDVAPERVYTVHLGADPSWSVVAPPERAAARQWLGVDSNRPLVVFVGALSHDHNKGLDTLWAAWRSLCAEASWDADLIVAGDGSARRAWEAEVTRAGLTSRVRLLGFTDRVSELLAAADLLVSPVRYEAFGLNVHEALCRGVPAVVSASAGVAECYTADLRELLLPNPESVAELTVKLRRWRSDIDTWRARTQPLAAVLRRHTWTDMARQIAELAAVASPR